MASKVHRVRYYNPKPQIVNCSSFNKHTKQLAIGRGDASIEIWDLSYAPLLVKFIPGVENGSVEALCWACNRLFSTGLGGALVEWDLGKLSVKNTVILTGYAAWCLDVNSLNTIIAVGTEQGYVNLYRVEDDSLIYERLFDKQEGRILCCKFNHTGNMLVTGSENSIRVWNVDTGHAVVRMSASRRGQETIVWCLAVLSDNVIVSGDSCGRVTFWDATVGAQIESFTTHKADILSIAVSDDEKSLYCSGVDPVILNFVKVNRCSGEREETQWVKNVQRHIHEHDVRSLVLNGETLISMGADGYITFSSFPPKWLMRIPPMIPGPRSSLCANKKLLLLRYTNHLEVWKLGTYITKNNGEVVFSVVNPLRSIPEDKKKKSLETDTTIALNRLNKIHNIQKRYLKLREKPLKLVSIKTKGKKQIVCCEMSSNGEFIIYSTTTNIRMLKLDIDGDQTTMSKVAVNGVEWCEHAAFSEDSRTLVTHAADQLHVLHVDPHAGATVVQTINTDKGLKMSSILHVKVCKTVSEVTYLVAADVKGGIEVWARKSKKFEHYASLPRHLCAPSALAVDPKRETIIVVYVDQKILEYELPEKRLNSTIRSAAPYGRGFRRAAAVGVVPHPRRDALVMWDDTSVRVLEKESENEEPELKRKPHANNKHPNRNLNIIPIKYLAGFHWINDEEAVTLEITPENIVLQLPPVPVTKRRR